MSTLALNGDVGRDPPRRNWDPDDVKALCARVSAALGGRAAAEAAGGVVREAADMAARNGAVLAQLGRTLAADVAAVEHELGREFDPDEWVGRVHSKLTIGRLAVQLRSRNALRRLTLGLRPRRPVVGRVRAAGRRRRGSGRRAASRSPGGGEDGEPAPAAAGARPEPLASPAAGPPQPASLTITLEPGELPHVVVQACSFEAEQALRVWVRGVLPSLASLVAEQLDADGGREGWSA